MKQLWSISTTIRNPERILPFLKVLKELDGQPFDKENQIKYQILLIQNHLYKPNNIPAKYSALFDDPTCEISFDIAKEVFNFNNYKDPSMRGRNSASPITKLGFSIARGSAGNIKVTELGNRFISGEYEIGYAFYKSLLKLQFPNPWSSDFSEEEGFNVIPFIATMHLIDKVNRRSDKRGLTRDEFCLFIPSLINFQLVDEYVEKVFEYRAASKKADYKLKFAKYFYQTNSPSEKQLNNFDEYGDNIMRYFRLTRYFKVSVGEFGAKWRIDIEPTRQTEVRQILKLYTGEAVKFDSIEKYLEYISDINLPILPSEQISNLIEIANSLISSVRDFSKNNSILLLPDELSVLDRSFLGLNRNDLESFISDLRQVNLNVKNRFSKKKIYGDTDLIQSFIALLNDHKALRKIKPEIFEQVLTDSLRIVNDEIQIKPNYPVDDDGNPISHAAGGQPDIECYYSKYNAICEVTLDSSNFQWVRESQPVMRHLREFSTKNASLPNYCIFVAPKIHEDTVYHFWTAIKYGYNGNTQKIVPLNTKQFAVILEALLILLSKSKRYSHADIKLLYDLILDESSQVSGHIEWLGKIDSVISIWKEKIIS